MYDPKYFDMLVSSTGQLSGIDRRNRIIEIGLKNIWLAARCTNTSIYKDPKVTDWIINRCQVLYSTFHDLQALVALLEMQEIEIFAILLDIRINKKRISKKIKDIILMKNATMSDMFSAISEIIPKELSTSLFDRLLELGYVLDDRAYNVLISRSETAEEANRITEQMFSTGVEATSNTYYQLIQKLASSEQVFSTFEKFIEVANFETEKEMINEVYIKVISCCDNMDKVQHVYDDYISRISKPDYISVNVYSYYVTKKIKFANSFDEASALYYEYYNRYIVNYVSRSVSKYRKASIMAVAIAYFDSAISHQIDYLLFKKVLDDTLNLLGNRTGEHELNKSIRNFNKLHYSMQQKRQLLDTILSCNIKIYPRSYNYLISNINTEEDFLYLISRCEFNSIDSKQITSLIKNVNSSLALLIFNTLKEKGYNLNIFIYNALIKKLPFDECIKIFKSMEDSSLSPDIQSLQPLLRKWVTMDQFNTIISLGRINKIQPDQKVIETIVCRVKELAFHEEFIEYFQYNIYQNNDIWDSAINRARSLLINSN